eukprot:UN27305
MWKIFSGALFEQIATVLKLASNMKTTIYTNTIAVSPEKVKLCFASTLTEVSKSVYSR